MTYQNVNLLFCAILNKERSDTRKYNQSASESDTENMGKQSPCLVKRGFRDCFEGFGLGGLHHERRARNKERLEATGVDLRTECEFRRMRLKSEINGKKG